MSLIARRHHLVNRWKVPVMRFLLSRDSARSERLARIVGVEGVLRRLRRYGLWPVRFVAVEPSRLLHQRTVIPESMPTRQAGTLDFLDAYFSGEDGASDWGITNSMQYRLLVSLVNGHLPGQLEKTDYWRFHVAMRDAGIKLQRGSEFVERSDEWIDNKVRRMVNIFESIKNRSYRYRRVSDYIWVVEKPLIHTRYGYDHCPEGYEIFDGHHRAAAVAFLGYPSVRVLLLKDVGTHTRFGVPLDDVVVPANG